MRHSWVRAVADLWMDAAFKRVDLRLLTELRNGSVHLG